MNRKQRRTEIARATKVYRRLKRYAREGSKRAAGIIASVERLKQEQEALFALRHEWQEALAAGTTTAETLEAYEEEQAALLRAEEEAHK